jgi:hypothetical protein
MLGATLVGDVYLSECILYYYQSPKEPVMQKNMRSVLFCALRRLSCAVVFVLTLTATALADTPPAGSIPDSWLACATNADCVDIYAGCNFEAAVNKIYAAQTTDVFLKLSSTMDCSQKAHQTRAPVCGDTGLPIARQCHLIQVKE